MVFYIVRTFKSKKNKENLSKTLMLKLYNTLVDPDVAIGTNIMNLKIFS